MPATKKKPAKKWRNKSGLGVLFVRSGWLWSSVAGERKTTDVRWPAEGQKWEQEAALDLAMKVLQRRALKHSFPDLVKDEAPPPPPPDSKRVTLYYAVATFKADMYSQYGADMQRKFGIAFRNFLVKGGDMALEYEAIRQRVVGLRDSSDHVNRTKQFCMVRLGEFFAYCVHREWLPKNPMVVVGKVKAEASDGGTPFEWKSLVAMLNYFRIAARDPHREVPARFSFYAVKLFLMAGLREGELLALDKTDIAFESGLMKIKGKRTKNNKSGIRLFPLYDSNGIEVVPGLVRLLQTIIRLSDPSQEKLFPWSTRSAVHYHLGRAHKELGIDRTIHDYRATAIWYWKERLKLSVEVRAQLAGHSLTVHVNHYHANRTVFELKDAISRERETTWKGA